LISTTGFFFPNRVIGGLALESDVGLDMSHSMTRGFVLQQIDVNLFGLLFSFMSLAKRIIFDDLVSQVKKKKERERERFDYD
jgi:hypothetical protein